MLDQWSIVLVLAITALCAVFWAQKVFIEQDRLLMKAVPTGW